MPHGWNPIVITLIPKTKDPSSLKDYRHQPFQRNLQNRGRAITNRFKTILGQLIDTNQSVFIPGRLITDNILICFECMHWLRHTKSKHGFAALKLDMSKIYDRIEWDYLKALMLKMGFNTTWVNLIMKCVSSVSYTFKVNDKITKQITPTRGLRQGNPLSPYLFAICSQGLSAMNKAYTDADTLHGIKIARSSPMITHLFFVDDSLILFKMTKEDCDAIKDCVKTYEKNSGQLREIGYYFQ